MTEGLLVEVFVQNIFLECNNTVFEVGDADAALSWSVQAQLLATDYILSKLFAILALWLWERGALSASYLERHLFCIFFVYI